MAVFFSEGSVYLDKVSVIAVDEAHLLESWGEEFRPAFNRICELRSFFTSTPVLLLSATVTASARDCMVTKMNLSPDIHTEWEVPDRPNIFLGIESYSWMDVACLNWYLDILIEKNVKAEKAVIYVSGISQMSRLALDVMSYLGQAAHVCSKKIFKLYHSGMAKHDLEGILTEFSSPESETRLLICICNHLYS